MTNILWLTTQFPSNPKDTKGSFIFRTVKELSKEFKITVICLHSIVPPILPMLKDLRNSTKIYKVWRNKYPKNPVPPENLNIKVIYAKYVRLPRGVFHYMEGWFGYFGVKKYLQGLTDGNTVIHATWLFPEGDVANIINRKFRIPFIVTLMGSDVHFLKPGSRKWFKAKNIVKKAKYITSVSKALYSDLEKKGIKIPENKKALTHTIYEFDKFKIIDKEIIRQKVNYRSNNKIIFYAGNLRKIKNIDVLINAYSLLIKSNSNITLFIAGIGEEEGKLKELTVNNNISENVVFLGGLNGTEIVDYFNVADVCCLPSQKEGLPNVVIESLLCGTPVVASAVGEIPYIIEEGNNGFLVSPNNIKELTNKLNIALNKKWDRNSLRKTISFLEPQKVLEEYKAIYSDFK
jgi:glycosyltransferase involved in cell wall biosynthesis